MSTQASNEHATRVPTAATLDLKIEVVVIPVSDVDRAKTLLRGAWDGGWTPISPPVRTGGWCR